MLRQRVDALFATGAQVHIISPGADLQDWPAGVAVESRTWTPGDFHGAAVVFTAFPARADDELVVAAARAAGALANAADRSDLCDFYMPAVVRRGAVSVAVSTDGASPALAARIRSQIEALLPARVGELASFAESFRGSVKALYGTLAERSRFWHRFFDSAAAEMVLAGDHVGARRQMMAQVGAAAEQPATGAVYIVGAGPGDPDLLTLQALRLMQQADIVLHDALVPPAILDRVRRDAERVPVGKRLNRRGIGQDAINERIVREAQAGKRVLRLKGGDPFVFGRGGEEADYARARGVEVTVAAGITAALGCAAAAGIPLTHRDHASTLSFVTAQGKDGEAPHDWASLAAPGRTLVIYMGLARAGTVAAQLAAAGLSPSTPAAIIENGSRPDQSASLGALRELGAMAARHGDGPSLLIIGDVVRKAHGWTEPATSRKAVS
jgi:uroporphyrin-III C-methyltransferase/precorrin-2 dehydrogenase/sirohydrochlorin ferrochelatase